MPVERTKKAIVAKLQRNEPCMNFQCASRLPLRTAPSYSADMMLNMISHIAPAACRHIR